MKQIEAVDYVETTVEWEQWALSDSDSESDLT